MKRLWRATWKISLFLVSWGLLYAPAVLLIDPGAGGQDGIGIETRLYLELFGALALLLAAWILTRFVDRRSFSSLGFTWKRAGRDAAFGLLLGMAMVALAVAVLWLPGWVRTVPLEGFSRQILAWIGAALLLNSVTQEVMVRGYALQTLECEFGTRAALLVSSALFTLLHAGAIAEGGILPAVNLFAAGILLGLAYTTTRRLSLPIALHFSWNFVQGPVLGIAVTGQALGGGWRLLELQGPELFTGGSFGLEAGLAATLATIAGCVVLFAASRRPDRAQLPARRRRQ